MASADWLHDTLSLVQPLAVLFDLDGTLVDCERESGEAMAWVLANEQGISVGQADRDFIVGRSWTAIYQHLQSCHPALTMPQEVLVAAVAKRRHVALAPRGLHVLPGACEAVQRFSHLGRALVTGSSTAEMQQALAALGLATPFDFTIASEDVSRSKPSPEGYLLAASQLGVPPESCVVIEDSLAGIAAGLAAKMTVVAVCAGNFAGQDQSGAHVQIETLDALTSALLSRAMVRASHV